MAARSRTASLPAGGGQRDAFTVMMASARSCRAFGRQERQGIIADPASSTNPNGGDDGRCSPDDTKDTKAWEPMRVGGGSSGAAARAEPRRPIVFLLAGATCALLALGALSGDGGGTSPSSRGAAAASAATRKSDGGGLLRSVFLTSPVVGRHSAAAIAMTEDGYASAAGSASAAGGDPFWIVFAARDGLGDQLFQYASSLGMMLSNSRTKVGRTRQLRVCAFVQLGEGGGGSGSGGAAVFDPAEALEGPLTAKCPGGVPAGVCGGDGCPLAHRERGYGVYTPLNLDMDGKYAAPESKGALVGRSLQSHRYFAEYEEQLREHLRIKSDLRDGALRKLKSLVGGSARDSARVTTVGVHLRTPGSEGGLKFPPKGYFVEAMRRLEEQSKSDKPDGRVVFVLLGSSADINLFRYMIPEDPAAGLVLDPSSDIVHTFLERNNDFVDYNNGGGGIGTSRDLALLASCDHVITTLGSFGWWGGWLSGGTTVYYRDQFDTAHADQSGKIKPEDYFPPDWVGIGASELALKHR